MRRRVPRLCVLIASALLGLGGVLGAHATVDEEALSAPRGPSFDLSGPSSLANAGDDQVTPPVLAVVDKRHALQANAVPPDLVTLGQEYVVPGFGGLQLRREAASALAQMLDAAQAEGHDLRVRSAYRSFDTQVETYAYWVSRLGEVEANRVSARPGHSEHQLGTTVDLTIAELDWALAESLAATRSGRWLLVHATSYGFALSYPPRSEAVTGYASEPWHYRYVGKATAEAWSASGLTLGVYLQQLDQARSLGQRSSTQ